KLSTHSYNISRITLGDAGGVEPVQPPGRNRARQEPVPDFLNRTPHHLKARPSLQNLRISQMDGVCLLHADYVPTEYRRTIIRKFTISCIWSFKKTITSTTFESSA